MRMSKFLGKRAARLALAVAGLSVGGLFAACSAQAADKPVLTVYTTDSFASKWGPGPQVKTAFEKECGCILDFVALDDGGALLSRLQLEGKGTKADLVLGLDSSQMVEAAKTGLFQPSPVDLSRLDLPNKWSDKTFVPFDYGWFAVVYDSRTLAHPPASLRDLVDGKGEGKILIEDPRTSTPGLGLLLWVKAVYGDKAEDAWRKLAPRVLTVSKSWTESYGLFTKGEAPMVLSYTTSPAYHIAEEHETRYKAAGFAEGQYAQVEVAAKLKGSHDPALADRFMAFMISPEFQSLIPEGNWMYPVVKLPGGLPDSFKDLVRPTKSLFLPPAEVAVHRRAWIEEWQRGLSR